MYFSDTVVMKIKKHVLIDTSNCILFASPKSNLKLGFVIDDTMYIGTSGALKKKLEEFSNIKEYNRKIYTGVDAYMMTDGKCDSVVILERNDHGLQD